MIMHFLEQNPEYMLGMNSAKVFPSWQEHPVSMLHQDHAVIYIKPLEIISST